MAMANSVKQRNVLWPLQWEAVQSHKERGGVILLQKGNEEPGTVNHVLRGL